MRLWPFFVLFILQASDKPSNFLKELMALEVESNSFFRSTNLREDVIENQYVDLEHYLVPLDLIRVYKNELSDNGQKILVEKHGKYDYLRWIKYPDDTKQYKLVEKFLRENGYNYFSKKLLKGVRTSSRSLFVFEPGNWNNFVNVKVGTDHVNFLKEDKLLNDIDVRLESKVGSYVEEKISGQSNALILHREKGLFSLEGSSSGLQVREFEFDLEKTRLAPGFVVTDENMSRVIAKLNGFGNVAVFWEHNFVRPFGQAIGEYVALTGLIPSSLHLQNILILMDEKYIPARKILLKDYSDNYYFEELIDGKLSKFLTEYNHGDMLINDFNSKIYQTFSIAFNPLLFQEGFRPNWMSEEVYNRWSKIFLEEFRDEIHGRIGIYPFLIGNAGNNNFEFYNWNAFEDHAFKRCHHKALSVEVSKWCEDVMACVSKKVNQEFNVPDKTLALKGPKYVNENNKGYFDILSQAKKSCLEKMRCEEGILEKILRVLSIEPSK